MGKWQDSAKELESLLRLRTFPLAIKRFKRKADAEKVPRVRKVGHPCMFCQIVGQCRHSGFTMVVYPEEMRLCSYILGLTHLPREDWHRRGGVWFDSNQTAEAQYDAVTPMPMEGHKAVVVAPLAGEKFEPDVILIHGNPAQMHLLMCAYQYHEYFRWEFTFVGETSCSDTMAKAYNTGKPSLSVPCYGQRRYGHVRDDELEMAIPPGMLDKGLEGLRWLSSKGFRYPIPFWGTETDPSPGRSVSYG